jgi:hypothetical protein
MLIPLTLRLRKIKLLPTGSRHNIHIRRAPDIHCLLIEKININRVNLHTNEPHHGDQHGRMEWMWGANVLQIVDNSSGHGWECSAARDGCDDE